MIVLVFRIILVAIVGIIHVHAQERPSWMQESQQAMARKDWQGVITSTQRVVDKDPSNAPARVMRSLAYLQLNDPKNAARSAGEATKADPRLLQGWLIWSEALQRMDLQDSAISVLNTCSQRFPDSVRVTYALGMAYVRAQRCEEAISPLEETMFRRPDNTEIVKQLASCYLKLERYYEAADLFGRMHEAEPNDVATARLLAEALIGSNRTDSAIVILKSAFALDANDRQTATALAIAYQKVARFDEARKVLEPMVERYPDDADLQYNLGFLATAVGDRSSAIRAYKKAIALRSNFGQAWFNIAIAYADEGFTEEAINAFQRASILLPNRAALCYNSIAILYRRSGSFNDAVNAHKQSIGLAPKEPEMYASLGHTYVAADKYAEGKEFLLGALAKFPGNADILYPLGKCYIRLGESAELDNVLKQLDELKSPFAGELRSMIKY